MKKKILKLASLLSFLIAPFVLFFIPSIKDITIASLEIVAEFAILTQLVSYFYRTKNNNSLEYSTICIFNSIWFVFWADTLNSLHILKITDNFALLSDWLYSGFAFFLLLFLIIKLEIFKRRFEEWGWIFLGMFILDGFVSYWYLFAPYALTDVSLAWRTSGAVYIVITALVFALILPFVFRISGSRTFWFFNLVILLLTSDFAIRYMDTFIPNPVFSWAEIGWCSTFIGFAWLIHFGKHEESLFFPRPLVLAPFISIRSLLTLCICGANILFLIGIFIVKLYSVQTAIDISDTLLLLFVFWTIANEFSIWLSNDLKQTLKYMFKSNENLLENGLLQFNLEHVNTKNHIFEILQILDSYNALADQTNKMIDMVIETNTKATMAEVAFQVSHDIRSPLAALDMAVQALPQLPEENRLLIRSSLSRIKDITNNLLQKNPNPLYSPKFQRVPFINDQKFSIQLLSSLIDRLISEKRMQFRAKIGIEIDSTIDERSYGIFANVDVSEFLRVISNLINNAVEALDEKGRVVVSLTQAENIAVISIVDNGKGIPAEIINNIGKQAGSFGKKNGSGIGLYHAFKTIESWKGSIVINSSCKRGTTVNVQLPLADPAPWFVSHLRITPHSKIAILDDDASIHQIWNGRFEKANAKNFDVEVLHFAAPEQLINWAILNKDIVSRTIFLVDYEFLGSDKVGLDVIEELGIQSQSVLISSHYEEAKLRVRCEQLKVQLIPKDMAGFVPITIETQQSADAILIDDDPLVHELWQMSAKYKHKNLLSFHTSEEFIKEVNLFAKNIPIYLDVSLAHGASGVDLAEMLHRFGFINIYLATGHDQANFVHLSFIQGIIGKHPPF
jgi:signal transduction histidine kinase